MDLRRYNRQTTRFAFFFFALAFPPFQCFDQDKTFPLDRRILNFTDNKLPQTSTPPVRGHDLVCFVNLYL